MTQEAVDMLGRVAQIMVVCDSQIVGWKLREFALEIEDVLIDGGYYDPLGKSREAMHDIVQKQRVIRDVQT